MQGIPAIVVHGGAGKRVPELEDEQSAGVRAAADCGWAVLAAGGWCLDAVIEAVAAMESSPVFNAGVGSVLNAEGAVEMDASLMEGTGLTAAAVGAVPGVRHPIRLARAVREHSPHVLLVGPAALARAADWGVELCAPEVLITPRQRERWLRAAEEGGGTVGAVAVDVRGRVAAATSTGGMLRKWSGRVGDSAVIGAGTYADDRCGAASATGHGEAILRTALARGATALLLSGLSPLRAARQAVEELGRRTGCEAGIILVDAFGRCGWACNAERMCVGWRAGSAAGTQTAVGGGQ
jgi:beta-aspartyl-peptidase (threonine type)